MPLSLYSTSVPILAHYLERLLGTLDVARSHSARIGCAESSLLGARLAADMFPFAQQISTACSFALRACCPLLNIDVPRMAGGDQTLQQLRDRVEGTLQFLGDVPETAMSKGETAAITITAGFAEREFEGRDYVLRYAMPNFFFHVAMAHAILRSQGVPVGKQDFDGFHAYPPGFSFPAPASPEKT